MRPKRVVCFVLLHHQQQLKLYRNPTEFLHKRYTSLKTWTDLGETAKNKITNDVEERGTRLMVVPMPLGEVSDASFRCVAALSRADIIACEDTRKTGLALARLGVVRKAKLVRHDANMAHTSVKPLIDAMLKGSFVTLVSDAGTPAISDPGALLVKSALDSGIRVVALPGPCAVTTAVSVSGLDTSRGFIFAGFPPGRSITARRRAIAQLVSDASFGRPLVFYESPRRLSNTLHLLAELAPSSATLVICRELTKIHEEIFTGSPRQSLEWLKSNGSGGGGTPEPRGEFTLVLDFPSSSSSSSSMSDREIEEEEEDRRADDDAALALLAAKRTQGLSLSAAAKQVARTLDLSKSYVYALALNKTTNEDNDNNIGVIR